MRGRAGFKRSESRALHPYVYLVYRNNAYVGDHKPKYSPFAPQLECKMSHGGRD